MFNLAHESYHAALYREKGSLKPGFNHDDHARVFLSIVTSRNKLLMEYIRFVIEGNSELQRLYSRLTVTFQKVNRDGFIRLEVIKNQSQALKKLHGDCMFNASVHDKEEQLYPALSLNKARNTEPSAKL